MIFLYVPLISPLKDGNRDKARIHIHPRAFPHMFALRRLSGKGPIVTSPHCVRLSRSIVSDVRGGVQQQNWFNPATSIKIFPLPRTRSDQLIRPDTVKPPIKVIKAASQLFSIERYHTQSFFLAPQTSLSHLTLFSQCPSIQFMVSLSSTLLSHHNNLSFSPIIPHPFSPHDRMITNYLLNQTTLTTLIFLLTASCLTRYIH